MLKAARDMLGQGQLIAVAQPHRYTRLEDLFEEFSTCFDKADHVLISPVYEAGEQPIEGVNHEALVKSMTSHGHKGARAIGSLDDLPEEIKALAKPGGMVI